MLCANSGSDVWVDGSGQYRISLPLDIETDIGRYLEDRRESSGTRIGRILIARGRDAADIPLVNSFGPHILKSFRVWTDETSSAALG